MDAITPDHVNPWPIQKAIAAGSTGWFIPEIAGCIKKVHSYIALYQVLVTTQGAPPNRPVHSNAILTSLGNIQPHCNYCTKPGIHLCN